jgi:phosphatidylethanolamine/phosphatidyl-N-methylethanolamine N-methyltransferase
VSPVGGAESAYHTLRMEWEAELSREHPRESLLAAFAKNPVATGAVAPSCARLRDYLTEGIDSQPLRTVVELGAGTGAVTSVIEGKVGPQTTVVAVELNRELALRLAPRFPGYHVVNESAECLPEVLLDLGLPQADAILSELPWTSFGRTMQAKLVDAVSRSLRPGGHFTTTAYWPAACFPAGRRFRRMLAHEFSLVRTSPIVWGNIPPAFVYQCRK